MAHRVGAPAVQEEVIRTLDARVQPFVRQFLDHLARHGIRAHVTSARRSSAKQAELYRKSQLPGARFPAAPPGTSTHERGLAFDVVFNSIVPPRKPPYPWPYDVVGQLWESLGFTWGGRFDDAIHFDFRRRTR